MNDLTYPIIEKISGLSLPQLKRCALSLYSDEKSAGGRDVERQFTLDQGFTLCLMGLLLDGYKFKVGEARMHAEQIFEAGLSSIAWLPAARRSGISRWFTAKGKVGLWTKADSVTALMT